MKKIKVMTIVGTRPELIKLSRVIHELDQHTQHILVHSGQNHDYYLNEIFFKDLEIRQPDYFLNVAEETPAKTIAKVIAETDAVLEKESPDAVLIYGDTNTGLAVIPAKRRRIPVFHMEAGNRCFDERVPEELNRRLIDHLSDINMPLTEHARRYLIQEGIKPETILKTGSSAPEILHYYRKKIDASDVLARLKLKPKHYFVVSLHREENVDTEAHLSALVGALNTIAVKYNMSLIVSTHPRTRQRLDTLLTKKQLTLNEKIQWSTPFAYSDYIKLQENAFCTLSDSGSITEDAALLNIPAVNMRNAHERPEGMDCGNVIMSSINEQCILNAIEVVVAQHQSTERVFSVPEDYTEMNVSKKVLRIILSYVPYVKRTVWFENVQ
jgi:UDP-N-acetylglucosamine 2-epimerase